jgi:histidyl-tRNA synthetase
MMPEVDTVKGFRDILPPESIKRRAVRRIIEREFALNGFLPLETPFIEYDELMRPDTLPGEQEDEAISDRFRLKDRGGRNLGLRYEFTFQLARLLRLNPTVKMPFRRYQIGEVFRDEPIGEGRYRQFTQCDIDVIGDSSIKGEVECIAIMKTILDKLGIEAEIQVNNRKLIQALIESCELLNTKQVMRELDKLDKIGEDLVKMNLKKYGDANQIVTLFKLLEKDISFYQKNKFEGAEEIAQLIAEAKKQGITLTCNPTLIRGLSYYTGNIIEIKQPGKGTLIAGGRYDNTVGKYLNKQLPAFGLSCGLDRLTTVADIPEQYPALVQLISIQQDKATQTLAQKLRKANIPVTLLFDKPGKCLEYASAYGLPYALFIGEDELKKKKFKLRDLKTGTEQEYTEKQLITKLSSLLF